MDKLALSLLHWLWCVILTFAIWRFRVTLSNEGWKLSGKLSCLFSLLRTISRESSDRVVVVSNFTRTLDLIQVDNTDLCDETLSKLAFIFLWHSFDISHLIFACRICAQVRNGSGYDWMVQQNLPNDKPLLISWIVGSERCLFSSYHLKLVELVSILLEPTGEAQDI